MYMTLHCVWGPHALNLIPRRWRSVMHAALSGTMLSIHVHETMSKAYTVLEQRTGLGSGAMEPQACMPRQVLLDQSTRLAFNAQQQAHADAPYSTEQLLGAVVT